MNSSPPLSKREVTIYLREMTGGVTTSMLRWARAVSAETDVTCVVTCDNTRPFARIDSALPARTLRVEFSGSLDNKRLVYARCAEGIRSQRAWVVANDVLELGMVSSLGLTNPTAFVLHGDYDYYYDLAVAHADHIGSFVCVSRTVTECLAARLPHRQGDIHLAQPIVPDPVRLRVRPKDAATLSLLFVGRTTPEKGFPDLPVVDSLLASAGIGVHWTVVAPSYGSPTAEQQAWLSKQSVTRIESVRDTAMEDVYARHDVLVVPSRYEGFGMAIVEAMKSRVVPVVSRVEAGVPEIIDDGISGFVVPSGDTASMASRIETLARDRALLETMADAARSSATSRFNSEVATRALTDAIMSARSRHGGRAPDYLSRLDRTWLPNGLVRLVRRTRRSTRESR